MAHTITTEGGTNLAPAAGYTLAAEAGTNLAPAVHGVIQAEGGTNLAPAAGHTLAAEAGTSLAPAVHGVIRAEGGADLAPAVHGGIAIAAGLQDVGIGGTLSLSLPARLRPLALDVWGSHGDDDFQPVGSTYTRLSKSAATGRWHLSHYATGSSGPMDGYRSDTGDAENPELATGWEPDPVSDVEPTGEPILTMLDPVAPESLAITAEAAVLSPAAPAALAAEGGASLAPAAPHTLVPESSY